MTANWFEHEEVDSAELRLYEQFNWIDFYPTPVLLTDRFWTILRTNSLFLNLIGHSMNKVIGRNISHLIDPGSIVPDGHLHDSEIGRCNITSSSNEIISCTISKRTIDLDGQIHRIVSLTPVAAQLNGNGKPHKVAEAHFEDTEAALRQSREQLEHVQKVSGIGSWDIIYGEKPVAKAWNFFQLLGLEDPGENITPDSINIHHMIHPDDLKKHTVFLEGVIKQQLTSYRTDFRITDKAGKIKHLHCESHLEYDIDGKVKRWTGSIQDISSYKKAENLKYTAFQISQLIHSQHNLTPLIEAIHQMITAHMPAPCMLVALTNGKEDVLHFPYYSSSESKPDAKSAFEGLIGQVLKNREPLLISKKGIIRMIEENLIAQPARIPQSWIGIPLKTHDDIHGVLTLESYSPDIIYSEEDKEMLIFVSEQIALSIQHIRSEEALMNAKMAAENSSRLKSSLMANMSHELRTPMTGILGFSEILTEELDDPRMKSMASTIYKSASRLMSTLNSIIDLSAIEADKHSLTLKTVNLRTLFNPLLKVAHSVASDKGLYLRTSLPPTLHVLADDKLLGQMIHHLLDNALKFTIDGGISMSAYLMNKASSEVIIRVSDTGIGIAKEHHKLIFEDFRQVSEGFSRTFEGSGIGLALCSKIANLLNARIWVESEPEKGSDFYVALPLALPDIKEGLIDSDTAEVIRTNRLSRGPIPDVLIVEDNDVNRRLAALYLREICNTEMAENGYVALEKIKRKRYDAILMDINLGAGPDGLSVANQAKASELNKNTPIIAVTGYTMHGDREKLLAKGCTHYLPKPYDKKTLLRMFTEILYANQNQ